MNQLFSSISINGTRYKHGEIPTLIQEKLNKTGIGAWEKSFYQFLSELIDTKDYITAQSSGTTGEAKQIKLKKNDLVESALRTQKYFNLNAQNKALLCLPVSYIAGKMMAVRAFVIGFDLHIVEPSSTPFLTIHSKIDFTALTPHQLWESLSGLKKRNVGKIIVGGAPVSKKMFDAIQELDCQIFETYGMTETCSHIAIKPINPPVGGLKSDFFQVLPGFEISQDKRGCLKITTQQGDVYKTNDIIEINDNSFKWLGRFDNAINSGGIKLFPEQIEKKLEPYIKRRFIISSEQDAKLGEQLVLIIETKDVSYDYSSLENSMDGILSFYERPKKLYLLSEFVETSNGKIKRKETTDIAKGNKLYVL